MRRRKQETRRRERRKRRIAEDSRRKRNYEQNRNTMIREKLTGVGVAMITPFTSDGRVDYQALARMIDYVIEGGVDYIVALGTTAETPTLYMPERAVIAMFITNHIAGRVPLVMGCGGNSTSEVLDQLREFDLRGADAILSVTPYYNKPSQEGLYQHFRTVSEHSPLPVILYNIPGRSGVNMTAETTLRLARDMKNVIGIKEASGDIEQMQRILARVEHCFERLDGRFVGIESRSHQQQLVQIGIRVQRFVALLIGVAVIEVVVILVGQRFVAGVVAHHQRRIVERRLGVHRLVLNILLVGNLRRGQRRKQKQ